MSFPAPHIIPARAEHKYTLILLHGRNSDGKSLSEELFEGRTSSNKPMIEQLSTNCKWIFPSARESYSTVFQEELQEWFDIYSLTNPNAEWDRQVAGLKESVEYICSIVEEEMKYLPSQSIILGGISQGFATASHVLFRLPTSIGGFVGLSGWIPSMALSVPQSTLSTGTPVYVSHSEDDAVVELSHGVAASDRLRHLGYKTCFQVFGDGGHWIQEPRGFDGFNDFLERCLQ